MNDDDITNWSDADIEKLINDVYKGNVSPARLPVNIYAETHKRLMNGVLDAFENDPDTGVIGSRSLDLLEHFNDNVAIFSGAKTHQQVVDMTKEVFKNGTKQSFTDFKESAGKIFDTYNKDWLKTEYNMAHNQALLGRRWLDIQRNKDIFPALKYVTVGDERVRHEHAILDGIVRPVDDPFWKKYYPQNDWGCRCGVEQMTEREMSQELTPDSKVASVTKEYSPTALFDGNVGIDKIIWSPEHPYFLVADRFKLLKRNNFNLPTPPAPIPPVTVTPPVSVEPPVIAPAPPTVTVSERPVFTPATSIKDAEKFARETLEIGFVNYKGLDLDIVNSMNETVFQTKSLMPKYKPNGIGNTKHLQTEVKKRLTDAYREGYMYKTMLQYRGLEGAEKYMKSEVTAQMKMVRTTKDTIAFSWNPKNTVNFGGKDLDFSDLSGIYQTPQKKSQLDNVVKLMSERKWFTANVREYKYIVNHELGHEVDSLLSFRHDPDFKRIFDREHRDGIHALTDRLSEYGATAGGKVVARPAEMIAECWAEFTTSATPRPLSREISELMLKRYHEKHLQGAMSLQTFIENASKIISK